MSTNYYFRQLETLSCIDVCKKLLDMNELDVLKAYLHTADDDGIHIGKQSCGWRFLFQEQPNLFENMHELNKFVVKFKHIFNIRTEHGDTVTYDSFIIKMTVRQIDEPASGYGINTHDDGTCWCDHGFI